MNTRSRKRITVSMLSLLISAFSLSGIAQESQKITGPLIGHTSSSDVKVWARLPKEGKYKLEVKRAGSMRWEKNVARARKENDLCVTWRIEDLDASTTYQYRLKKGNKMLKEGPGFLFRTAPSEDSKTAVHLAFGSGSGYKPGTAEVWSRISTSGVDGMVLLGDTPYIDNTDLSVQREKYREFSNFAAFQDLAQSVPFWGTWDDHDFAYNDSDGTAKGKENSLKVFKEYRPNATFGDGSEGIYTRFRYGVAEVFLLDTRWWSWTGPSFADASKKTLLGITQWEWLKKSLLESDAPFKLIACGMIWDDKKNGEKDDWGTYMHEREALFEFIGTNKISGVVLIGGDIHVSRVLKYKTEKEVGYPIYQFITSPLHDRTIESLNVPHPDLIRDAVIPFTFMKITVDPRSEHATLTAEFIDKDNNKLFEDVVISEEQLSPKF